MSTSVYYNDKALRYGIADTRLHAILSLFKNVHNKKILDVGCATGYVGEKLRAQGNYVYGTDISKKAIQKAKKVLDKAFVCNIEEDQIPLKEKVDYIILAEVIEHLFYSKKTVKKLYTLLQPGGTLIISTPNIMYWGHRLRFLKGNFSYSDQGVFDESHVHFFSHFTLQSLLKDSGFKTVSAHHIAASPLSSGLLSLFPGVFAYHLLFEAKK